MGEGKFIGRRYIFVRFKGCPLSCIYCDEYTKDSMPCRVEEISGSGEFREHPNIADNLVNVIEKLKRDKDRAFFYFDPPFAIRQGYEDIYEKVKFLIKQLPKTT